MTLTRIFAWALCGALFALGAQAQAQNPAPAPKPAPTEDWAPSDADKRDSEGFAIRWLGLKDADQGAQAYALFSPLFREKVAFEAWNKRLVEFNRMAGKVRERRMVQVTWFHEPPHGPLPGDYVAIEFHGAFERIAKHQEVVVLHRPRGGGAFAVLRNEVDFVRGKPAPGKQ